MTPDGFFAFSLQIGFVLILVSLLLGFARLARGPTFSDRVVALDMMSTSVVAFCAVDALQTGTPAYLDVAIVLALINFLSTLALARFAERALDRRRDHPTLPAERLDHVTETHSPEGSPPETRP
ncbi:MAG: cation:proton antiporter [Rhodobacteraceae bacterium]|nr:cation:proton antiporter [Paracoccaceae bacterium]